MSSSFVLGIGLGLVLGTAGTYLALEKPWGSESEAVAVAQPDAGPVEEKTSGGKRRGKRRGKKGRRAGKEVGLQEIDERVQLTAADRKMVWQGPAVNLPERNLDMSSGGGGRSLEQGEISSAVNGGQNALMRCIADARGQAELAANITLKFLVNGNGGIGKVRVRAPSYLLKNGLYPCAGKAIRGMRFPSTGAATVVMVPLDLSY
ncbi:MAG: hypothetical protein GY811_18150 [Myxococcales bacterium]|nr:hypothetical protein [Myxococcales bacterium]